MFKNKKGFTLIEFIIVMAIIGILVLMAAPKFLDYVEKAKVTQIKNDIKVLQTIVQAEVADNKANGEEPSFLEEEQTLIIDKVEDDSKDPVYYNISGGITEEITEEQKIKIKKVKLEDEKLEKSFNTKLKGNFEFYYDEENNEMYAKKIEEPGE